MQKLLYSLVLTTILSLGWNLPASAGDSSSAPPLVMVVQDPLAAPLSCPCVEGYAQRKYEKLGTYLEEKLGRKVNVVFAGALNLALKKKESGGRADIIIGKNSVVRSDAAKAKVEVTELGHLTDKEGKTMQHGLIVVYKDDPAKSVADLKGYTIIFGPEDCDEKHAAAMALLEKNDVPIPDKLTIDEACSDGASKVVDLGADGKTAAVISSYAAPLLEGCGTVKKGDLRVIGKTKDVQFISAFATDSLSKEDRRQVQQALLSVLEKPELCQALESLVGFIPPTKQNEDVGKTSAQAAPSKKN
jgi:ABC-type phosphate/phosphonate transport system substrate-binding protein